ncbi:MULTISPECIES: YchJ family protein [unclassified Legionella]|uniref:YchJ family protein n=1 Tax=unclassified Legionella TaxID=2622702 RepID=UPI001F5F611B|nr:MULTISPECIES: YchJ family protein [unclassified Legionella]MDI9819698.1 YchJ family protein [Legionella sp. PL877]
MRYLMVNCPCDSQKSYLSCCEPFITGKQTPETPEALMRSRYTAYAMANIDYIKETMRHGALIGFQETEAKRWAKRVHWIKLHVLKSDIKNSTTGYVEFEASFVDGSRLKSLHEKSRFMREEGQWYYVGGTHLPTVSTEQMISRTINCPCGSQRKFKNCHGKKT